MKRKQELRVGDNFTYLTNVDEWQISRQGFIKPCIMSEKTHDNYTNDGFAAKHPEIMAKNEEIFK